MFQEREGITNICIPNIFTKDPKCHVAILNDGFTKSEQDEYIVRIAEALDFDQHLVTIYAYKDYGQDSAFDATNPITGHLHVRYIGTWIPDSIFGFFQRTIRRLKSFWMALQLIAFPQNQIPELVFVNIDSIVLPVFAWLSRYKTIYVYQHPNGPMRENYYGYLDSHAIAYASYILVENKCLKQEFQTIFPKCCKGLATIYPSHDTRDMILDNLDIKDFIPDFTNEHYTFSVFGNYDSHSNFELALDALDCIHIYTEGDIKHKFHLVIAGNCDKTIPEQLLYHRKLVERTCDCVYKKQVIFLKNTGPALRKALYKTSVAVIDTSINDVYPGSILEAMSSNCAILATNTGFAKNVLEHNRTALLIEPRPFKFSEAMYVLAQNCDMRRNISSLAYHKFMAEYSHEKFKENLTELLWRVKRVN